MALGGSRGGPCREYTGSLLFLVALRTTLVLSEIPSSSVMFGVSSEITEVLILQRKEKVCKSQPWGCQSKKSPFTSCRFWEFKAYSRGYMGVLMSAAVRDW